MSAASGQTEDLPPMGDTPANNIVVRPLNSIPSVPTGGYVGALGKTSLVSELRKALSNKLEVPYDVLSIAYAGHDLDDSRTLRDNGIVEPGAAARRSGARIELIFTLLADTLPGEARRRREAECREQAERDERKRLEREAAQARMREESAVLESEQNRRARAGAAEARAGGGAAAAPPAAAAVAQQAQAALGAAVPNAALAAPAAAFARALGPNAGNPGAAAPAVGVGPLVAAGFGAIGQQAAPAPAPAPPQRDECVLRCLQIGIGWEGGAQGDDPALVLETRLSTRVADAVHQLHGMLGGGNGGDELFLVHRGHVLAANNTLAAAGLEDGSEVHYYFGTGGAAGPAAPNAAPQEDNEGMQEALAAVAAAEAAEAQAAEQQQNAARFQAVEEQWHAAEAARQAAAAEQAGNAAPAPAEQAANAVPAVPAAAAPEEDAEEDEDLYGPPEPSGPGPTQTAAASGHVVPPGALDGPEAQTVLEELRAALMRPRPGALAAAAKAERPADRMTEAELVNLLRRHVPDVSDRTAMGGETPVTKVIFAAYRRGPQGAPDVASTEQLGAALRRVMAVLHEGEKVSSLPEGYRRALCRRLVQAFESGEPAQVRVIELLAEGLSGGSGPAEAALSQPVLALALEARERAVDVAVLQLHPEAALSPPQLAQLALLYRQRLGFSALPFDEASQTGSTDAAALRSAEEASAALGEALDLQALAMTLLVDVNSPASAEARQVDLSALHRWAEATGGDVLFEPSKAELYNGRPTDEALPFLHPLAAAKVVRSLLLEAEA